jgi:GNAT superfamily N-acetyltransferase
VAPELTFRTATLADAPVIARTVAIGFEGYRAFAAPGWEPPTYEIELATTRERLVRPDAWALLAFDGDEPAGQVSLLADPAPATVYLWQLFVRPKHWGTGLADRLHAAFLAEARDRGYERGRLRTPAGQARARRFYERSGWETDGVAVFEERIDLELLDYTRVGLT